MKTINELEKHELICEQCAMEYGHESDIRQEYGVSLKDLKVLGVERLRKHIERIVEIYGYTDKKLALRHNFGKDWMEFFGLEMSDIIGQLEDVVGSE